MRLTLNVRVVCGTLSTVTVITVVTSSTSAEVETLVNVAISVDTMVLELSKNKQIAVH